MRVSPRLSSQSGVSLVELLVVCVIIAVVASLALMQRGSANEQFQRQNVARQLKGVLERARFDSVKRRAVAENAKAKVVLTGSSFTLRTDSNQNGVTTDTSDAAVTTAPTGVTIRRFDGASFVLGTNDTVAFNMRGEVAMSPPPQFIVCNGTCPATEAEFTPDRVEVLIVTPTGTVNLLPGAPGAIIPFTNPTLAGSTSTTDDINPDVTMP